MDYENVFFDCNLTIPCSECRLKSRCDIFNREEESDSFPVGYLGGDFGDMEEFGPDER